MLRAEVPLALGEGQGRNTGGWRSRRLVRIMWSSAQIRLDRGVVEVGAALPQLFGVIARRSSEPARNCRPSPSPAPANRRRTAQARGRAPASRPARGGRRMASVVLLIASLSCIGGEGWIAEEPARALCVGSGFSTMVALLSLAFAVVAVRGEVRKKVSPPCTGHSCGAFAATGSTKDRDSVTIPVPGPCRALRGGPAASIKVSGSPSRTPLLPRSSTNHSGPDLAEQIMMAQ